MDGIDPDQGQIRVASRSGSIWCGSRNREASGIQLVAGRKQPRTSKPSGGGLQGRGGDGGEAMSRRGRTGTATRVRPGCAVGRQPASLRLLSPSAAGDADQLEPLSPPAQGPSPLCFFPFLFLRRQCWWSMG
jgi:hypothetical protein